MPLPPFQKAKLSRDAHYLLNRTDASRDRVLLGSVAVVALGVVASHALSGGVSGVAVAGAAVGMIGAGYVAAKSYLSVRATDAKLFELAQATEQDLPEKNTWGLLDASAVARIVQKADFQAPDLVKAIADRRERRWDAVLEADYRPPSRPGSP